jgi:hypothetical protein
MSTRRAGIATLFICALVVVLIASIVSPLGGFAAAPTRGPAVPGPHSGARSTGPHIPSGRRPSPTLIAPGAAATCDNAFDTVASPSGTGNNALFSTAANNANDVWAVGASTDAMGFDKTLIEHFDGTSWSIIPSANPGAFNNDLNAVAVTPNGEVWAVGDYSNSNNTNWFPFALHWTGSTWITDLSAGGFTTFGFLYGVTAISNVDVWAVGTSFNFTTSAFDTHILHWNGAWSLVPGVNLSPTDNEVFSVSAWSSTDIWAVGELNVSGVLQSLALEWNGVMWNVINTPNLGGTGGNNEILGVNALEAGHAVGVGYGNFVNGVSARHASTWDIVAPGTPTVSNVSAPGIGDSALLGVARSGGIVWGVGFWRNTALSARQTLAAQAIWDSVAHTTAWGSGAVSASPGSLNNALYAATALSPNAFWATGYQNSAGVDQTLTELFCGVSLNVGGPASTTIGSPFSLNVLAVDHNMAPVAGYRGIVHFTSSDTHAVLPADYMFTSVDAGSHTFAGIVLNSPGQQTITVYDTVTPFITGTKTMTVLCVGACPGPPGTVGSRATTGGPAGVAGVRGTSQSGGVPTGPRLPTLALSAQSRATASDVRLSWTRRRAPSGGFAPE